jgi:hypothetical protein
LTCAKFIAARAAVATRASDVRMRRVSSGL